MPGLAGKRDDCMPVGMGDIFGHWMAGVYTVGSRPYPYEGRMNTAPAMVLEIWL